MVIRRKVSKAASDFFKLLYTEMGMKGHAIYFEPKTSEYMLINGKYIYTFMILLLKTGA